MKKEKQFIWMIVTPIFVVNNSFAERFKPLIFSSQTIFIIVIIVMQHFMFV